MLRLLCCVPSWTHDKLVPPAVPATRRPSQPTSEDNLEIVPSCQRPQEKLLLHRPEVGLPDELLLQPAASVEALRSDVADA
eukprot:5849529-Pyramimonas_sp.AAC.1